VTQCHEKDQKEVIMLSLEQLEKIQAFNGLTDDQLLKLQPHCTQLEFPKGTNLFTEGDPAEHLWVVTEGSVKLRFERPDKCTPSDEPTVSSVEAVEDDQVAQTFGWSCFIPPFKMRLSAFCVANKTIIVKVAKSDLIREFENDPQMGYTFLSYLITVVGYRFSQFRDEIAKIKGEFIMAGW
jgi:signal-transduction protein with cAMP-binding, CBS, and nucleotidyltransferase domain